MLKYLLPLGLAVAGTMIADCGPAKSRADAAPHYRVAARIKGADGGWDYASFDPVRRRLYVSRTDTIMTVDVDSGAVTAKLAPASRSHIILAIPGTAKILETDGGTNTARILDAVTGAELAAIPTGKGPDAAVIEPVTGLAFVMDHAGGDVTVIDTAAQTVVGTIPVGGVLEFAAADGAGRIFVNIEDKGEIAVIDARARTVTGRYTLAGCEEPSGLAYAPQSKLLVAACANGKAKVLNAADGSEVATLTIGPRPDFAISDPGRGQVLIPSGGDGTLAVISVANAKAVKVVQTVQTQIGARTGTVDPKTGRVYLPTAKYLPPDKPGTRPTMVPGSFEILVVEP